MRVGIRGLFDIGTDVNRGRSYGDGVITPAISVRACTVVAAFVARVRVCVFADAWLFGDAVFALMGAVPCAACAHRVQVLSAVEGLGVAAPELHVLRDAGRC